MHIKKKLNLRNKTNKKILYNSNNLIKLEKNEIFVMVEEILNINLQNSWSFNADYNDQIGGANLITTILVQLILD